MKENSGLLHPSVLFSVEVSFATPRAQPARYVTVSFSMASEIPPVSAEEPGLLEDAEARLTRGHEPEEQCSSSLETG